MQPRKIADGPGKTPSQGGSGRGRAFAVLDFEETALAVSSLKFEIRSLRPQINRADDPAEMRRALARMAALHNRLHKRLCQAGLMLGAAL